MPSLFDLTGRLALITGSSRGIGRTIAHALAEAGADVVLHGRDPQTLADTHREFTAEYGEARVRAVSFAVTDEAAVQRAVARIESEAGSIGILVNNAGVQHREPLVDISLDDWNRVIDTNVTGAFTVGRAVARRMLPRGEGKIINICSVQTELARPTIGAYTAAKRALRNLTRAMAAEWAGAGLQINGIAPGYIHTEMTQALVDDEAFNSWVLQRTPARRWGAPADLAGPAVWLASAASDFVNGQVVFVDGGMTAVV